MSFVTKLTALKHVVIGYYKKWLIDLSILKPKKLSSRFTSPKYIVSLTSYGRRIDNVLYYTLVSLLRQTYPPDMIVVWLDVETRNDKNLPEHLNRLRDYGVYYYYYYEDIRSYKKLIPSIIKYPNDIIITVDDDMIYSNNLIESLVREHEKFPNEIICRQCRFPKAVDGKLMPYNSWVAAPRNDKNANMVMPLGVSGVLYPPQSLHKDILQQELFQKMCPLADDIWIWIMAKRKGTKHRVIDQTNPVGDGFDDLYQYFHKGSALTHSNSKENQNDIQLNNLIEYFKLSIDTLTNTDVK